MLASVDGDDDSCGSGNKDPTGAASQQLHCLPVAGATDTAGNEFGKLFIGGLSQLTNETSLRCHFGMYGQVEDAVVMMDSQTGRSRGFGFVKFRDPAVVDAVLETSDHVIDGKAVDVKQSNINVKGKSSRSLKIFVGGIAPEHDSATVPPVSPSSPGDGRQPHAGPDQATAPRLRLCRLRRTERVVARWAAALRRHLWPTSRSQSHEPPNSTPPLLPLEARASPLRRLLQRLQRHLSVPATANSNSNQQQLYKLAQPIT
uniref:RRM domain-containing protein n=1 Tax=Macrostomum lignano TaxID=282301 RepID=A0A1I8FBG4_9PLAT